MNEQCQQWLAPPLELALACREVAVWRISLEQSPARLGELAELLTQDETARAQRFYFERDRIKFTIARGALRIILARYLNAAPASLTFSYGAQGKPALTGEQAWLNFNLSHSGMLALCAVAQGRRLGVDIECERALNDAEAIAQQNFSAAEVAVFRALPMSLRNAAFFNCWTRKEAFIKAIGQGLSYPLDKFDVTLRPAEPARFLNIANDSVETARWTLRALMPAPGYTAALACEGEISQLHCYEFPSSYPT
jgi:4'-phosphopantetheinyl transferase